MTTTVAPHCGPAFPLGLDRGLPLGSSLDEEDLERFPANVDMTSDLVLEDWTLLEASPIDDFDSPASSGVEVPQSPGKASLSRSDTAASSSSPNAFTPTSTLPDFAVGDAAPQTDIRGASSSSCNGFATSPVVGRMCLRHGQAAGGQRVDPPELQVQSFRGAQIPVATRFIPSSGSQTSPLASIYALGGWMDSQDGHWTGFTPQNNYNTQPSSQVHGLAASLSTSYDTAIANDSFDYSTFEPSTFTQSTLHQVTPQSTIFALPDDLAAQAVTPNNPALHWPSQHRALIDHPRAPDHQLHGVHGQQPSPSFADPQQVGGSARQHPQQHGQSRASAAVTQARRNLQPALPGRSDAHPPDTTEIRPRKGGRAPQSKLKAGVRQRSSNMRKIGACWHCVFQRDQCLGDDTPCERCKKKDHKGLLNYLPCDRTKLPHLIHDFLPPSMCSMHTKQSIEDYVVRNVAKWDKRNSVDVYLTSGYGPTLRWRLYEFEPKDDEPVYQLQYFQDPQTGLQVPKLKYSPPFALMKLDMADDVRFDRYMDELLDQQYLWEFGWTCFEEETATDDFQARLLQLMCNFFLATHDHDTKEVLQQVIKMMILTYIMHHTLTISEEDTYAVLDLVRMSQKPSRAHLPREHVSPRLATRQLKFFFAVLREKVYTNLLKWQQQTMHHSKGKAASWLPAFCVTLGLAMVLEDSQHLLWIQATTRRLKDPSISAEHANAEAANACDRIDACFGLLVGLFQHKYRDKTWSTGSFGNGTPMLQDAAANAFLANVHGLLLEKQFHLVTRRDAPIAFEAQGMLTSRLVARFLLPFLTLPAS